MSKYLPGTLERDPYVYIKDIYVYKIIKKYKTNLENNFTWLKNMLVPADGSLQCNESNINIVIKAR